MITESEAGWSKDSLVLDTGDGKQVLHIIQAKTIMTLIKNRPGALLAVFLLITIGLTAVVVRTAWMRKGGVPAGDRVWELAYHFDFHSNGPGAIAYLALPFNTAFSRVLGENFYFAGMRQVRSKHRKGALQEAVFATSRKGTLALRAEFQIDCSPLPYSRGAAKTTALSADDRHRYLEDEPYIPTNNATVNRTFQKLFSQETDKTKLLERIAEFCEKKIALSPIGGTSDAAAVLVNRKATTLGRARTMVTLCRIGKIPARVVSGFVLAEKPEAQPHYWVETFMDKKWVSFDPENGYRSELPFSFIPVRRGGSDILRVEGASHVVQQYSVTHIAAPPGFLGRGKENFMEVLDLTRLPLSSQSSLIILLMLPIGALLTTFARNVVGVTAFGTFSPALLALAIVYVDWLTALIIFIVVVIIGIGGRALLPGLKLMKIPRLSVVFTLVAVTMALTVSALSYLSFTPSGYVVLLPLVVLTNIVDRFYSVADEDGMRTALLRLGWTITIALGCVLIFQWGSLGRLLLTYPELHLFTLALLLLMGLYNARKLTDFPYLHLLAENKKKKA